MFPGSEKFDYKYCYQQKRNEKKNDIIKKIRDFKIKANDNKCDRTPFLYILSKHRHSNYTIFFSLSS